MATQRTAAQNAAGRANLEEMRHRQRAEDHPPALTHGVSSFLNTGRLPDDIRECLNAFQCGLETDLGGDPSTAQRALVESSRICMGVVLLAGRWVAENGAVRRGGRPVPVLGMLAAYLNTLRLNLMALGLERRTKYADLNAPPPNATDEERRAWSQRYVANALAEDKVAE